MGVEQVHIIQLHPLQRLVDARHQILTATPFAIRAGPHIITRLRGYEQLIAVRPEIFVHQPPESLLRTPVRVAVVIGEVEMGNAVVKCIAGDSAAALERGVVTEVVPETQAYLRQQYTAQATTIIHRCSLSVPFFRCYVARLDVHYMQGLMD